MQCYVNILVGDLETTDTSGVDPHNLIIFSCLHTYDHRNPNKFSCSQWQYFFFFFFFDPPTFEKVKKEIQCKAFASKTTLFF